MPLNVPERLKLRVADFVALEATGAFAAINKVELLDGDIIIVNSQHRPHSHAKFRLARAIEDALASASSSLGVLVEASVEMAPHDLPEPDIVVTSEPRGKGFVPLATVALIVEVSDSTIHFDMRTKAARYAAHGVPEYWVVDLNTARIVRMWQPGAAGYAEADATQFGATLAAVTITGLVVETGGLD